MEIENDKLKKFTDEWAKKLVDDTWAFPKPMKDYWYLRFKVWILRMLKEFLKYLEEK